MDASTTTSSTRFQRSLGWFVRGLLVAVCVMAGSLTILPALLGFQRYVVTGTAMNGTIAKGSVVFDRAVPTSSLKVGDVITYQPPAGVKVSGDRITDRIVRMTSGPDGRTIFQTKGDSSTANDPWQFYLSGAKQSKVAMHIPYVGTPLALLETRPVRIAVIGAIIVLIALRIGIGLFIEGAERKGRHAVEQDAADEPLSATSTDTDNATDEALGASRAAALAALIAASSAAASSRGLNGMHEIPTQQDKSRSRAAS
jgi:signal peptidase